MRIVLNGLMVLLFLSSCGEKMPDNVIPQYRMQDVLVDVHLVDGQLASMPIDSARAYRNAYYDAVFIHYGIDSTMFRRSIEFYSTRPYIMSELYAAVEKKLDVLNTTEQQAIEASYRAQRLKDSINTARLKDSLRLIARDSLDLKLRRRLLFPYEGDSTDNQAVPAIIEALRLAMWEAIGLDEFFKGYPSLKPNAETPADSIVNAGQNPSPVTDTSTDTLPIRKPQDKIMQQ